jgi:hypothetical protein
MDKRTDARIEAMIQSMEVQEFFKPLWDTLKPFINANAKLTDLKVSIIEKCLAAGFKSKGMSADKRIKMTDMIDRTLVICSSLFDYADDSNNNDLKENVDMARYKLNKLSDLEKANACDVIVSLANFHIGAMGTDYIIVPADITDLADAVTAFRVHIPKPRQVISTGATAREEIRLLVKEAYKVLKKLDKLMEHFKKSNFDFYDRWFRARNIILRGEHSGDEGGNGTEEEPPEDEYVKDILRSTIAKIDFVIQPELTYLITHLAGKRLKWWMSASPDIPTEVPTDYRLLEINEELETKGVDLDAANKPYMFFANDDPDEDAQVAVDMLEE